MSFSVAPAAATGAPPATLLLTDDLAKQLAAATLLSPSAEEPPRFFERLSDDLLGKIIGLVDSIVVSHRSFEALSTMSSVDRRWRRLVHEQGWSRKALSLFPEAHKELLQSLTKQQQRQPQEVTTAWMHLVKHFSKLNLTHYATPDLVETRMPKKISKCSQFSLDYPSLAKRPSVVKSRLLGDLFLIPQEKIGRKKAPTSVLGRVVSTSVVVVPPPPDHEDAEPSPYLGEENTERYLRYCETWLGGAGMMGSLCVWRGFCPGVKAEKLFAAADRLALTAADRRINSLLSCPTCGCQAVDLARLKGFESCAFACAMEAVANKPTSGKGRAAATSAQLDYDVDLCEALWTDYSRRALLAEVDAATPIGDTQLLCCKRGHLVGSWVLEIEGEWDGDLTSSEEEDDEDEDSDGSSGHSSHGFAALEPGWYDVEAEQPGDREQLAEMFGWPSVGGRHGVMAVVPLKGGGFKYIYPTFR